MLLKDAMDKTCLKHFLVLCMSVILYSNSFSQSIFRKIEIEYILKSYPKPTQIKYYKSRVSFKLTVKDFEDYCVDDLFDKIHEYDTINIDESSYKGYIIAIVTFRRKLGLKSRYYISTNRVIATQKYIWKVDNDDIYDRLTCLLQDFSYRPKATILSFPSSP